MAGFSTTVGGLNFQYPNRGTTNWDAVMANSYTTISTHNHDRDSSGSGATLTDRSLLALNAGWLQSADFAGTGTVNLIRASTSDTVELGGDLNSLGVTTNLTVGGTLGVTGATSLAALTLSGTCSATTLGTSGLATLDSLLVTNAANMSSTLGVTGATSLSTLGTSGLATLDSVDVTTTLDVTGHTDLSTLGTSGLVTAESLTVTNAATLNGTLDVVGAVTTTAAITTGDITLPIVDGTAAQVLTTDGAGTVSFADVPSTGKVLQVIQSNQTSVVSTTGVVPLDNTIPQNTEGAEFMTANITPTSATSNLIIDFHSWTSNSNAGYFITTSLFRDSAADALLAVPIYHGVNDAAHPISFRYVVASGSTSATTFKIRFGPSVVITSYMLRRASTGELYGTTDKGIITITEVEA